MWALNLQRESGFFLIFIKKNPLMDEVCAKKCKWIRRYILLVSILSSWRSKCSNNIKLPSVCQWGWQDGKAKKWWITALVLYFEAVSEKVGCWNLVKHIASFHFAAAWLIVPPLLCRDFEASVAYFRLLQNRIYAHKCSDGKSKWAYLLSPGITDRKVSFASSVFPLNKWSDGNEIKKWTWVPS